MTKSIKPSVARELKIHTAGDVVESGIVIIAKRSQCSFDNPVTIGGEEVTEISGEFRIVETFFGFEKYAVEINGHWVYGDNSVSKFETLAEAAQWLGF